MLLKIVLFLNIFVLASCLTNQCIPRDYGNGGTVCVCTENYCDTFDSLEKLEQGAYVIYTSNKDGLRFNKTEGQFQNGTVKPGFLAGFFEHTITINVNITYQKIMGFGGAFTDSTGINILSLNESLQKHLYKSYFSKEGLEYNLCRIPIGGTDFSTHAYTYDDNPGDVTLQKFNLTSEDYDYKIPMIKMAQSLSKIGIIFFGSAWSAPPWMKTNDAITGLGFLKKEYYQQWADYHIKFMDAYKKEGINMWGLTTGNEPINGYIPVNKINSMGWTPFDQSTWISNNLGPVIRNSVVHHNTKIMILDDQRFFLPWWTKLVLNNNETRNYVDGIAVHWYYDDVFPAFLIKQTHDAFPEKFILATEACTGSRPWDKGVRLGAWKRGESYCEDILQDLNNYMTGWVDWNMALDEQGGPTYIENFVDSPIIVNATAQEFYKQPMFYALGHFSKFLPPNSVRIDVSANNNKFIITAFKRPDNGTVLIILNKNNQDISVTINDERRGHFQLNVTKKSITTTVYW